jgi:hypothetical protein
MLNKASWVILMVLALGLFACDIRTPEIKGVVLDAETRQPIENAWVHASIETKTKTIQGPVQTVWRVEPPHTRTNNKGEFVIPSRKIEKPAFPYGLGTEIENFSINASTIDDKSGGFYLKEYEGKKKIETKIYVKPWEGIENEREYFSYIQSLFHYCFSGRLGIEVPVVEGGCDSWEFDFIISKHRRYLDKFKTIAATSEVRGYRVALDQLSALYEEKGDFERAIEILQEKIILIKKQGLLKFEIWQKNQIEIERKIDSLRQKLRKDQK